MNNGATPGLSGLLNMGTMMSPVDGSAYGMNNNPGSGNATALMPSFELGGMVGPGGSPVRPNIPGMPGLSSGPSEGGMGPQQMEMEARRFVQQNPQQVAEIREAIEEALADGDITMDQVQLLTNMAKVALQNPEMYPSLKQSIVARGVLEEDELPPEFDQGTMFVLLLIGQIIQAPAQGGMQPPASQGAAEATGGAPSPATAPGSAQPGMMPSMAMGGPLPPKSANPDGSIPIKAHEGEYVIPSDVVRAKGTEFFDKLVQSYTQPQE
jgi:hypothetical protein